MSVLFLKLSFSAPLPSPLIFGKYAYLATKHVEILFPVVSFRVSQSTSEFLGHSYALLWSLTHVLIYFVKQNGEPLQVFLVCYFIYLFFAWEKHDTEFWICSSISWINSSSCYLSGPGESKH